MAAKGFTVKGGRGHGPLLQASRHKKTPEARSVRGMEREGLRDYQNRKSALSR